MPGPRALIGALAIGALGGALFALWVTISDAQGSRVPVLPSPALHARRAPAEAASVARRAGPAAAPGPARAADR